MTTELNAAAAAPDAPAIPRSLFVFATLYGGMTVLAGVLGAKQVALGPLAVEAGIFAFLLLVALSSAVAELHGRASADKLVRFGFIPLITAIVLTWIVISSRPMRACTAGQEPSRSFSAKLAADGGGGHRLRRVDDLERADLLEVGQGRQGPGAARAAVASVLSQIVDTLISSPSPSSASARSRS